jgi:hypothetical protein
MPSHDSLLRLCLFALGVACCATLAVFLELLTSHLERRATLRTLRAALEVRP